MQAIPLRKRILFYLTLLPIVYIVSVFSFILMVIITGSRDDGVDLLFIPAFPITHYIFVAFFLKTKLKIKLIVPPIITLPSFGVMWLIWYLDFFDTYGYVGFIILMSLLFAVLWEIAYQILKRYLNKNSSSQISP